MADIRFNPSSSTPGPFAIELNWEDAAIRQATTVRIAALKTLGVVRFEIPNAMRGGPFRLRVTLNGNLAFLGRIDPTEDVLF